MKTTLRNIKPAHMGSRGYSNQRKARNSNSASRAAQKTILVAVDFSAPSERALDYAVARARLLGCDVLIVHVLEKSYADGFLDADQREERRALAHAKAERRLDEMIASRRTSGVHIQKEIRDGLPEYSILAAAEGLSLEMIVIGRKHRNALSRMLLGSVTQNIVDASPVPVLVMTSGGK